MRVYRCDACGRTGTSYTVLRVKEFTVSSGQKFFERKRKIHLCGDCFSSLKSIAKNAKEESDGAN